MFWKKALKYPVLIVGIVLFALYITNPKTKEYWANYDRRFIPSTCDALKDRMEKQLPDNWNLKCPGTQLLKVEVKSELRKDKYPIVRSSLYQELANSYIEIGRVANPETLSNLKNLELKIVHPQLIINSKTDGQAVVELRSKRGPEEVKNHLKLTVKVKEL